MPVIKENILNRLPEPAVSKIKTGRGMMRKLAKAVFSGILLLCAIYAYLLWANNKPQSPPALAEIASTLETGIDWLEANRNDILQQNHSILWFMLQRSAEISDDPRLWSLVDAFKLRNVTGRPKNVWRPLFDPGTWVPFRPEEIDHFPDYNKHFVYALTCDRELGQRADIIAQNDPTYCDKHFHYFRPTCVTHQLVGIRLMQRSQCGVQSELAHTVTELQKRIRSQLTWDPRVVDTYLQRVMLLVESGARETVKPVWIHRIIGAQRPDGGWSGAEALIPVNAGQALGFTGGGLGMGLVKNRSDFHATAQAILLFTLLKFAEENGAAP